MNALGQVMDTVSLAVNLSGQKTATGKGLVLGKHITSCLKMLAVQTHYPIARYYAGTATPKHSRNRCSKYPKKPPVCARVT